VKNSKGTVISAKPVEKTDKLVSINDYDQLHYYMPANDINPNPTTATNIDNCKENCNTDTNCKYFYFSENQCYLGNKPQPAYVPIDKDNLKSTLYLRKYAINSQMKNQPNIKVDTLIPSEYRGFNPIYFGTPIKSGDKVGYPSTSIGAAIIERTHTLANKSATITNQSTTQTTGDTQTAGNTRKSYASAIQYQAQSGFQNREGFDSRGYFNDMSAECGQGDNAGCLTGVLKYQINPLKQISQDYSNKLNKINSTHYDLSNNIVKYNDTYYTLNNDPNYDFSGSQPIIFSDNTDLLTESKNDSKNMALQTNNLYIAGSMLTTTLLIFAIYLGKP
jgi:hypothetical protein